jgi:hypothetical protein
MPLPPSPYDPANPDLSPVSIAPGRSGAALYPDGTVFVAQQTGGAASPVVVTEWDLASGKDLGHATVPLRPGVQMVFTSEGLIAIGKAPADVRATSATFLLLGPDLRPVALPSRIEQMGAHVQSIAYAYGDPLVAIVYQEYAPDGATELAATRVATWDSTGHAIGQRRLDPSGQHIASGSSLVTDVAVVVEGTLFVMHYFYGAWHLLHLSPELAQLGDRVIARGAARAVRLKPDQGHLVAEVGDESYAVTFDMEQVQRMPGGSHDPPTLRLDEKRIRWPGTEAQLGSEIDGRLQKNWVSWEPVSALGLAPGGAQAAPDVDR